MAISVTDFTLAAPSGLTVKTATLAALDTSGAVTHGVITESATPPLAGDGSWLAWNGSDGTRPAGLQSQTLTAGAHTLYGHAKDAAGNRGTSAGQGVTVSAPATVPTVVGVSGAGPSLTTPVVSGGILSTDLVVGVVAGNPASLNGWTKRLGATGFSVWYCWGSPTNPATGTRGQSACIRGSVGSGDPFDVVSAVASSADDTAPTAASVTTLGANRLLLFAAAMTAVDENDLSPVAGFSAPTTGAARTQVFSGSMGGGNAAAYALGVWSGGMAAQGASGSETVAKGAVSWVDSLTTACALLAVKPA